MEAVEISDAVHAEIGRSNKVTIVLVPLLIILSRDRSPGGGSDAAVATAITTCDETCGGSECLLWLVRSEATCRRRPIDVLCHL